jgi:hypothetical protein
MLFKKTNETSAESKSAATTNVSELTSFAENQEIPQKRGIPKWKRTVIIWLVAASIVFIINLVATVYYYVRGTTDDLELQYSRTLYEGSCSRIRSIDTGLHLLVNVLSTILVTGSGYCMQILSAPTRSEINRAHLQRSWLDIGVLSLRNLTHISKWRTAVWVLLAISSASLHLFYNSAIFSSVPNNPYYIYSVNDAFANINYAPSSGDPTFQYLGEANNVTYYNNTAYYGFDLGSGSIVTRLLSYTFDNLTAAECLNAYAQEFQTRGDVLVVAVNASYGPDPTKPQVFYGTESDGNHPGSTGQISNPYKWMCAQLNSTDQVYCPGQIDTFTKKTTSWQPFGFEVQYCLSDPRQAHCRVQADLSAALIAGILSLAKVVMIAIVVFAVKDNPMLTTGDAVSSFLEEPDTKTKSVCLLDKSDVSHFHPETNESTTESTSMPSTWLSAPKSYRAERRRWFTAVSIRRWIIVIVL